MWSGRCWRGLNPTGEQLYLLSFSSSSDTFQFSLLLRQITPPVTLQPLLTKLHAVWNFPPHLSTYINLLQQFPTLALFDNISNPRPPSIVYSPFGHAFVPTSLLQDPLLEWVATFFEGPQDTPMWCPERCPDFTGDFPFLRHVQFCSIFTTNTKKPMNSLLSPSFFYRGTLLELFLQLRTFSFVRSIILPLPNQ